MTCSNFEPSFEKGCHLCFSSFRGRLFEGKRLGFCKKVGWLTFNLQRAQFSLDCGFLLNNPTLGEPESRNQFRISCSRSGSESVTLNRFRFYILVSRRWKSPIPIFTISISVLTLVLLWNQGFTPLAGRSVVGLYYLPLVRCQNGISTAGKKWHFDCWKKWHFDC